MTSIHIYDPATARLCPSCRRCRSLPGDRHRRLAPAGGRLASARRRLHLRHQCVSVQFTQEQASVRAITRWARGSAAS